MLASPDSCVLLIVLGALLICYEFCRPGLVLPSAAGSFLALGGLWRLMHSTPLMPALHFWIVIPPAALCALTIALLLRIAVVGRASKRHLGAKLGVDQALPSRYR